GQHDVHDPDSTDDERDRGDRPQNHCEESLRLLRLLQELERYEYRHVLARVELIEDRLNHRRRLLDVLRPRHDDRDLTDLDLLDLERTSPEGDNLPAESQAVGGERYKHHPVQVRIGPGLRCPGQRLRLGDADDRVLPRTVDVIETDALAHRVL